MKWQLQGLTQKIFQEEIWLSSYDKALWIGHGCSLMKQAKSKGRKSWQTFSYPKCYEQISPLSAPPNARDKHWVPCSFCFGSVEHFRIGILPLLLVLCGRTKAGSSQYQRFSILRTQLPTSFIEVWQITWKVTGVCMCCKYLRTMLILGIDFGNGYWQGWSWIHATLEMASRCGWTLTGVTPLPCPLIRCCLLQGFLWEFSYKHLSAYYNYVLVTVISVGRVLLSTPVPFPLCHQHCDVIKELCVLYFMPTRLNCVTVLK